MPLFVLAGIHFSVHPCFFILENNGNYALNNQSLQFTFNLWRAGRPSSACNHSSISTAFLLGAIEQRTMWGGEGSRPPEGLQDSPETGQGPRPAGKSKGGRALLSLPRLRAGLPAGPRTLTSFVFDPLSDFDSFLLLPDFSDQVHQNPSISHSKPSQAPLQLPGGDSSLCAEVTGPSLLGQCMCPGPPQPPPCWLIPSQVRAANLSPTSPSFRPRPLWTVTGGEHASLVPRTQCRPGP